MVENNIGKPKLFEEARPSEERFEIVESEIIGGFGIDKFGEYEIIGGFHLEKRPIPQPKPEKLQSIDNH